MHRKHVFIYIFIIKMLSDQFFDSSTQIGGPSDRKLKLMNARPTTSSQSATNTQRSFSAIGYVNFICMFYSDPKGYYTNMILYFDIESSSGTYP